MSTPISAPARARSTTAPSSGRRCRGRSRRRAGSRCSSASFCERAARVGDRDELRPVAARLLEEVAEVRERLDRPARLRRDEEERLRRGRPRARAPATAPGRSSRARAAAARARAARTSAGSPRGPGSSRPCRAARSRSGRRASPPRRTPPGRPPPRASARRSSASPAGWRPRARRPRPRACRPCARSAARRCPPSPRAPLSAIAGSRSSGIELLIVGGRPVTTASRTSSTPSSSAVERLDERVDALREELVGDVVHVDARRRRAASSSALGSWSAVAPRDLGALRGGEQRRHRHRVDGVRARRARRRTSSPGSAGS